MKKKIYLFIIAVLSVGTLAIAGPFSHFHKSLQDEVFIDQFYAELVTGNIRLRPPNILHRFQTGAAYYHDLFNTIYLQKENLVKIHRGYRVKSSFEMIEGNVNYFPIRAETIFHEMAHAEYDTIIEENNTSNFKKLMDNVRTWFKKNHKGFNSKIAMHELYGYSAGQIVALLYNDLQSILMNHGLNYQKKYGCMSEGFRKKVASRLGYTADNYHFETKVSENVYQDKYFPEYIFVKGKDLKIKSTFPLRWKESIYKHFRNNYGFPKSTTHLIERMNRSGFYKSWLKKCYQSIINE